MLVQAIKRNNEWVIPNIPELQAQNEDQILLDVQITQTSQHNQAWSDEYIKQNWKAIGMDTHSADSNDNDIKYEAYARFYNEKHSH